MFSSSVFIDINAPQSKVWDALTKPELIKQYFFGTNTVTDWEVGGSILWKGSWEGKEYEDKGTVVAYDPPSTLTYTYWSSMGGTADLPENYLKVTYTVIPFDGGTRMTITQDDIKSKEALEHSDGNWKMVLEGLKKFVEGM